MTNPIALVLATLILTGLILDMLLNGGSAFFVFGPQICAIHRMVGLLALIQETLVSRRICP